MPSAWRRRRIARLLSSQMETGEALAAIDVLGLGGWWALSDRALYVVRRRAQPTRHPLAEMRSVRVTPGRTTAQVTVISVTGDAVVGDLRPTSDIVARLRDLRP